MPKLYSSKIIIRVLEKDGFKAKNQGLLDKSLFGVVVPEGSTISDPRYVLIDVSPEQRWVALLYPYFLGRVVGFKNNKISNRFFSALLESLEKIRFFEELQQSA